MTWSSEYIASIVRLCRRSVACSHRWTQVNTCATYRASVSTTCRVNTTPLFFTCMSRHGSRCPHLNTLSVHYVPCRGLCFHTCSLPPFVLIAFGPMLGYTIVTGAGLSRWLHRITAIAGTWVSSNSVFTGRCCRSPVSILTLEYPCPLPGLRHLVGNLCGPVSIYVLRYAEVDLPHLSLFMCVFTWVMSYGCARRSLRMFAPTLAHVTLIGHRR